VIFREFDGLGLGIEDHDAMRLRVSPDGIDLQIIQRVLQVKTLFL